jgi:flagellar hook-associated protein 3 FlgL
MTQRITSQMVDNTTVATIDYDLNQLESTQAQLSTGYKINEPSDDPVGAAISISLSGQISAYKSYGQNVSQGTAWTSTASQALQSIAQVAQSARELTVEAANGTMSSTDLKDAAQSVLSYISQIKETADTQYDGSYVFSGSDVQTQPWSTAATAADPSGEDSYSGNTDAISYAIGPGTEVQVNANLYSVLGSGDTGGLAASGSNGGGALQTDGSGGLLATLRTIYNDLTGTGGGSQQDLGNQLTNLDTNISSLESVQATVGSTQDRLQLASTRITALTTTDQIQLGNVEDTDMAAATTAFSTEQASYQAALQSTADIIQTSLMNFLQA